MRLADRQLLRSLVLSMLLLTELCRPARAVRPQVLRDVAERALRAGNYARAVTLFLREASVYRRMGDVNAAKIIEDRADRWDTHIELYRESHLSRSELKHQYTGAKAEPLLGCYLGAYIRSDDRIPLVHGPDGRPLPPEKAFSKLIGKPVGSVFDYVGYGQPFPLKWARSVADRGVAPQVAWEPNDGLGPVKDDNYLRQFARDCAKCPGPVFMRFASEMNGNWCAYNGNPRLFRAKFRLVHDVMAKLAPNVVMVWCVYEMPEYNIDSYYPGDNAVDWVGVNIYSVVHHNNKVDVPSWFEHPASMLRYVYNHYSKRKPIVVCEYGASHREHLDLGKDYAAFAAQKLSEMFSSLPRQFPRVKMAYLFDCNNLLYADPGRRINNYCVTDHPLVLNTLRRLIASDWYLGSKIGSPQPYIPEYQRRITPGTLLWGAVRLSAWVVSYNLSPTDRPTVVYALDGKTFRRITEPGDYSTILQTERFRRGFHRLSLLVYDARGRLAGRRDIPVKFG